VTKWKSLGLEYLLYIENISAVTCVFTYQWCENIFHWSNYLLLKYFMWLIFVSRYHQWKFLLTNFFWTTVGNFGALLHMYIDVSVNLFVHVCVRVCMQCMHAHARTRVCVCMCVCMCMHVCVCMCMHACMCMCICKICNETIRKFTVQTNAACWSWAVLWSSWMWPADFEAF